MDEITQSVEIDAPLERTRKLWAEFVAGITMGPGPTTGEVPAASFVWYRPEREAEQDTETFDEVGPNRTRLTVTVDYDPNELADEQETSDEMMALLLADLMVFKKWAEAHRG